MKKILFFVACCLTAVLPVAAEPQQDQTAALLEKISPVLAEVEQQLNEIEADFWRNIREIDTSSGNYLRDNPVFQDFNGKVVAFTTLCGNLQRTLHDFNVDLEQFPVEKRATTILDVWKRLPQLHDRIEGRRNPVSRDKKIKLDEACINAVRMSRTIPADAEDYETLLDNLSVINMELFYIPCKNTQMPPIWRGPRGKFNKYMSDDLLISSAGEFFMAVRDLRLIIRGLRTDPYPKPAQDDDPCDLICRIETDLNRIEREFWDNIYKGGTGAARNNNLSRYGEFRQRLYRLHVNSRTFHTLLSRNKIAIGKFNPVADALTIYNIGRSRDQDLRRQMRRYFNRSNPFVPGSKRKRIECLYHFRARNPDQLSTMLRNERRDRVPEITPFVPHADIVMLTNLNENDSLCRANIAIFHSEEKEFDVLSASAAEYFNAVKRLRETIAHWKEYFAAEGWKKP